MDRSRLLARKALVTGAGSGIGAAVALRFAQEGAIVAVIDVRTGAAEATAGTIRAAGGSAYAFTADVGDESAIRFAVNVAATALGGLDAVAACAGITYSAATDALTLEAWEMVMRVNVTGVFLTVKHALPHLVKNGGAIVTIGSVASLVAAGRCSAYDASKGAVAQFTRSVAVEYVDSGVRANCICPGVVATDLSANSLMVADLTAASTVRRPLAERVQVPMARRAGASEIAAAAAFLCSEEASFITGALLPVDGGYTAV